MRAQARSAKEMPGTIVIDTPNASSAPYAAPNLQVVEVPGSLGQKIMRLRYIAPKDDQGNDVTAPVRLHLELF